MSPQRWQWLAIAVLAALAWGGAHGVAARGAREHASKRGEIVKASLPGRPHLDYFVYLPKQVTPETPLLVSVHGIAREARAQAELFAPLATKHGFSVVAPLFDDDTYNDYQRLGRRGKGARADAALDRLLDELERKGIASGRVFLFGYSGGAQFVHRYVMAHPQRVSGGIAAAAGWYTFPDPGAEYPYGIRVGAELPGVRLRPSDFLRVPMLAVVGDDDRERDENLRQFRAIDRQQGRNRVERARRWVRAMRKAAAEREIRPRVELALLDGAGHSFEDSMRAGLGELVVETLERWSGSLDESGRASARASEPAAPGSPWCMVGGR